VPHLNATGRKMPGQNEPPLVINSSEKKPNQDSPWQFGNWLELEGQGEPPLLVSYQWLEDRGIFSNRMDAHRKRKEEQFPPPIQLSKNKIAWVWAEVRAWLASRPRRIPGQTNPAATLNLPQFRKAAREKAASKPEGAAP
jgi:Prophage CP4-57 regulatory protein (AlpA)